MAIVGFDITKIHAEKNKAAVGKIDIANNLSIIDIKEAKLNLGTEKKSGLEFNFLYASRYNPEIGIIEIHGKVIYMEKEDKVKEVLDSWKKDKKIKKDIVSAVYNSILSRCNVQAIILSREVALPAPIPLPKVSSQPAK
ncbi:MAG: hypothetical protein V1859_06135 [archaeon]